MRKSASKMGYKSVVCMWKTMRKSNTQTHTRAEDLMLCSIQFQCPFFNFDFVVVVSAAAGNTACAAVAVVDDPCDMSGEPEAVVEGVLVDEAVVASSDNDEAAESVVVEIDEVVDDTVVSGAPFVVLVSVVVVVAVAVASAAASPLTHSRNLTLAMGEIMRPVKRRPSK